jgi:hypothetical protein
MLEPLVTDAWKAVRLAGEDGRLESRRLEPRAGTLGPEEAEEGDDEPAITRSRSSQPSTPPLSAAAPGSSRSRPGGVGIWGGLVQMRSKACPRAGSKQSPRRTSSRSATPFRSALALAHSTAAGTTSVARTRQPSRAASTAASPTPVPISSTVSPERKTRWRQKRSDPALGGWTPSSTRNAQPR